MDAWVLVVIGAGGGVLLNPLIRELLQGILDWGDNLLGYLKNSSRKE